MDEEHSLGRGAQHRMEAQYRTGSTAQEGQGAQLRTGSTAQDGWEHSPGRGVQPRKDEEHSSGRGAQQMELGRSSLRRQEPTSPAPGAGIVLPPMRITRAKPCKLVVSMK